MKNTVKTSRTAGYLEKMFRAINNRYFNNELEEPIITIQSTPRAYGHVTVSKSWRKGEEHRHELNIGAGTLDRPIEDIVATLIHECCHLYAMQNGIQDTSRGNAYHNKRFKKIAEARDLIISYHSTIGWSVTEPSENLLDFIIEQGWTDIMMNRNEFSYIPTGAGSGNSTGKTPPKGKPTHTRKYQCPCCGNSVRATKEVNILCMDCNEQMIMV